MKFLITCWLEVSIYANLGKCQKWLRIKVDVTFSCFWLLNYSAVDKAEIFLLGLLRENNVRFPITWSSCQLGLATKWRQLFPRTTFNVKWREEHWKETAWTLTFSKNTTLGCWEAFEYGSHAISVLYPARLR